VIVVLKPVCRPRFSAQVDETRSAATAQGPLNAFHIHSSGLNGRAHQWLICQGLADGKVLEPSALRTAFDLPLPEQHEQPGPCPSLLASFGSCRASSLVAWAVRDAESRTAKFGARRKALRAAFPQSGQSQGSPDTAMGLIAVNGPQSSH
jgi:hypothetical protein